MEHFKTSCQSKVKFPTSRNHLNKLNTIDIHNIENSQEIDQLDLSTRQRVDTFNRLQTEYNKIGVYYVNWVTDRTKELQNEQKI